LVGSPERALRQPHAVLCAVGKGEEKLGLPTEIAAEAGWLVRVEGGRRLFHRALEKHAPFLRRGPLGRPSLDSLPPGRERQDPGEREGKSGDQKVEEEKRAKLRASPLQQNTVSDRMDEKVGCGLGPARSTPVPSGDERPEVLALRERTEAAFCKECAADSFQRPRGYWVSPLRRECLDRKARHALAGGPGARNRAKETRPRSGLVRRGERGGS
jgi:hypothetical protein